MLLPQKHLVEGCRRLPLLQNLGRCFEFAGEGFKRRLFVRRRYSVELLLVLCGESGLLYRGLILAVVVVLLRDRSRHHVGDARSYCWSLLKCAAGVDFVFMVFLCFACLLKWTGINLDWFKRDGKTSLCLETRLHNHSIRAVLIARLHAVLTAVFRLIKLKVTHFTLLIRVFIHTEELIHGSEILLKACRVPQFLFTTS